MMATTAAIHTRRNTHTAPTAATTEAATTAVDSAAPLVWYHNGIRWWPALYYPSHQVALQHHVNLSHDVKDLDHKAELLKKFLQEDREGTPQPVVQLIRSRRDDDDGVYLTAVGENDQLQHDDFPDFFAQLHAHEPPSKDLLSALAVVEDMMAKYLATTRRKVDGDDDAFNNTTASYNTINKDQAKDDNASNNNAAAPSNDINHNGDSSNENGTVATLRKTSEKAQSVLLESANNKSPRQASPQQQQAPSSSDRSQATCSKEKNLREASSPIEPNSTLPKDPTRNLGPELSQEFHANFGNVGDNDDDDDAMMVDNNNDDDNSETEKVAIGADDSWDTAWFKLQMAGWYKRASIDDPLQSFFVQPGRGISESYQEGIDYFSSQQDVKDYIRQQYPHWNDVGCARRVSVSVVKKSTTTTTTSTPVDRTTKAQDPAIPLLSAGSTTSQCSLESCDFDSFGALWDILKQQGWKSIRARNPLQDWWYIRPGRSASSHGSNKAGEDYFETREDVIEFCQAERRAKQQQKDPVKHVAVQGAQSTRKRKQQQRGHGLPRKKLLSSASKMDNKKRGGSAKKSTNPSKRLKTTNKEHWWKTESIPAVKVMWPILEKLGFYKTDQGYSLPKDTPGLNNLKQIPIFQTATGLRKFLCRYGVPGYKNYEATLSELERELLRRWIAFANVPVHPGNSVKKLRDISALKKDSEILQLLYRFGFSTANQRIYVPSYTRIGENARLKPVHGVHYFNLHELRTAVKCYVRKVWRFGLMFESDQEPGSPDRFLTPTKTMSLKEQEIHLRLRLWAAVTMQDLTTFAELPADKYMLPLCQMPDTEESDSDDDDSFISSPESCSDSESAATAETLEASPADFDESTVNSPKKRAPILEKRRGKAKAIVKKPEYPDFKLEIWPILQEVGFLFKGSKYVHPLVNDSFDNTIDLQKFCCCNGIPNADSLDKEEKVLLHLWASFAFVDVPLSSIPALLMEKLPSHKQIRSWLEKLGFNFFDGKIFPPGADSLPGSRSKRQHKIHFYLGMDEIRDYIRQSESLSLIDESQSTSRRQHKDIQEITLKVRAWAARSPNPLPKFQPSVVVTEEKEETFSNADEEDTALPNDVATEQAETSSLPQVDVYNRDDSSIEEREVDSEQAVESDQKKSTDMETAKDQDQSVTGKENEQKDSHENKQIFDQSDSEAATKDNSVVEEPPLENAARISTDNASRNEKPDQPQTLSLGEASAVNGQWEPMATSAQRADEMNPELPPAQQEEKTGAQPLQKKDNAIDETQVEVENEKSQVFEEDSQTLDDSDLVTRETQIDVVNESQALEEESQTLDDSELDAYKELCYKSPAQSAIQSIETICSVPRPGGVTSPDGSVASKGSLKQSILETLSKECELPDEAVAANNPQASSFRSSEKRSQGLDVLVTLNYVKEQAENEAEEEELDDGADDDSIADKEEDNYFGAPLTQPETQDENSDDDDGSTTSDDEHNNFTAPLTQADEEEYQPSSFNRSWFSWK